MKLLAQRCTAVLKRQKERHRLRTLESTSSAQGRVIKIDGQSLLNFSSNDYLGLSGHPEVCAAAAQSASTHGVGSGASALLSGRSDLHVELENRIAEYTERDRALLFSSGYLANLGVIGALVHRHDHAFQDRLNHASLIDAVALTRCKTTRYPHLDTATLAQALARTPNTGRWIITDTVFSMDGDIAPLRELAEIASAYDAVLVGDDAHGFGVIGGGRGAGAEFGLNQEELPIQIITFGKALGTVGAAVVGSDELIETLVQNSRTFIYDTAPPPMIAAATIAALDLAKSGSLQSLVAKNIEDFRQGAAELPLLASTTPIQPIMIGSEEAALAIARRLRARGIYTRAIRPPTVPIGTARLRICISAAHRHDDIVTLTTELQAACAEHRL